MIFHFHDALMFQESGHITNGFFLSEFVLMGVFIFVKKVNEPPVSL
jgi:hypothetical protein